MSARNRSRRRDSGDRDFYRRLAEHRAEHESGFWANRPWSNQSPAITTSGLVQSDPWRAHGWRVDHMDVCRDPAVQTVLAESLRADVDRSRIVRVVFQVTNTGSDVPRPTQEQCERRRVLVQPLLDSWISFTTEDGEPLPETMAAFVDLGSAIDATEERGHWIQRIDLA